ncbi:MAG: DUF4143 domain-containing protein [Pseudohongiellaceae bacterium]
MLESARLDPHGLIQSFGSRRVVLDEFQYAPELIPAIKEASDALSAQEKGKFILTGSADIFRSARTQEALPGHMARLELLPLSIREIRASRGNFLDQLISNDLDTDTPVAINRERLAELIILGGYPEVQSKTPRARQMWFKSYTEGRLFKDFETLYAARGDYHSKIHALIACLAGLSGNLLKYSSVGGLLEIDDRVVKRYIEVLELMFIVNRLPAWVRNRSKRLATVMPKVHFVDTGLACHLLGLRTPEELQQSQYFGGLLENLVMMDLIKQAGWAQEEVEIYHFRDKRKNEVDIVLERADGSIFGIEVKAAATAKTQDFRGLAKLAEYAGDRLVNGYMFYSGSRALPFKVGERRFFAIPLSLLFGQ